MSAVSIGPAGSGPLDTSDMTPIGYLTDDVMLEGSGFKQPDPDLAALGAQIEASIALDSVGLTREALAAAVGGPIEAGPTPMAVLIDYVETIPVYEPREPWPFVPARGFWAWFSGADAARERSWRGRYAAYRVAHDAWVAEGCPTERQVVRRLYIPRTVVVPIAPDGSFAFTLLGAP